MGVLDILFGVGGAALGWYFNRQITAVINFIKSLDFAAK